MFARQRQRRIFKKHDAKVHIHILTVQVLAQGITQAAGRIGLAALLELFVPGSIPGRLLCLQMYKSS